MTRGTAYTLISHNRYFMHRAVNSHNRYFMHRAVNDAKVRVVQDRRCTYKRNSEESSLNHSGRRKALTINYFECSPVALFIQHAMRTVVCGLSDSKIFFTLSDRREDFWKKLTIYKKRVLIFSPNLSKTFLVLRRTERDIINEVHVILVRF